MPQRESAEEKVARIVTQLLDDREKRAREKADPKARFDSVMDRLESFLDSIGDDEPKSSSRRRSSGGRAETDETDGGPDIIKTIFG